MIMSDERGVTLAEIIVVSLIIAIISAIILPRFHLIERYKLKIQAENMAEDLRYTQKLAMSENASYHFKLADDFYFIRKVGVLNGSTKKVYMPSSIKFDISSRSAIKYTSNGTPGNAGDGNSGVGGTITLLSNNYRISLTVIPVTGRVTVYQITKK